MKRRAESIDFNDDFRSPHVSHQIGDENGKSVFQIKRFFRYLLFQPFECCLEKLIPT